MPSAQDGRFRLMTYNLGGGRKDQGSNNNAILDVIREASPDILAVQEATAYIDAEGASYNIADEIAQATGFGSNYGFDPVITMEEHMHVRKAVMLHALFNDWREWKQGNALFCRWGFARLGDTSKAGLPRGIPIFRSALYEGNRDTDPRHAILARANRAPVFPFIIGVHLTTLLGERDPHGPRWKDEQAQIIRFEQAKRLLDLVREHLLNKGEIVFLLGDFNAMQSEACISSVLEAEGGFVPLKPSAGPSATHPKVPEAIDHILVYPEDRLVDYSCWIVDTPAAHAASDHLPVVADVTVR